MDFTNQRTRIIIAAAGVVVLALIAVAAWLYQSRGYIFMQPEQQVAIGEPVDIVLDFYTPWLAAVQSTTTDPFKEGLAKSPILSFELSKKIRSVKFDPATRTDAVLCQASVPTQITARPVFQDEENAQVLVVSRDKNVTEQAVITLTRYNDGWYLSDIQCSPGEFAPEREFSFDMEGFLLKSVQAPLKTGTWHLVFEQNGQPGHVVPLFFNAESICQDFDGSTAACDSSTFIEPSKARVQGEMSETGVTVKRLQHIEWEP